MKYKNRNVFPDASTKRYPSVYWPEHEKARPNGCVYVHQDVVLDSFGSIPEGYVVHHIDEDVWNWSKDNLQLVSRSHHGKLHKKSEPIVRKCSSCGKELEIVRKQRKISSKVFCSGVCDKKNREVISWPSVDELIRLVSETSYSEAGRRLGVSDNAIRKRIKNHGS